jgi:hypothetical protein
MDDPKGRMHSFKLHKSMPKLRSYDGKNNGRYMPISGQRMSGAPLYEDNENNR